MKKKLLAVPLALVSLFTLASCDFLNNLDIGGSGTTTVAPETSVPTKEKESDESSSSSSTKNSTTKTSTNTKTSTTTKKSSTTTRTSTGTTSTNQATSTSSSTSGASEVTYNPGDNTINITENDGYGEGAYVKFQATSGHTYKAYYSKSTETTFHNIDDELVRIDGTSGRVDVLGLEPGNYYIKIVDNSDSSKHSISDKLTVSEQDRSGYAHFNYSNGVGAYNDNGTLKNDAVVIYVTDATKNTVTYGSYTGLVDIISHAKKINKPLDIRIIGTIKTAQWNSKSYSGFSNKSELATMVVNSYNGASASDDKYYAKDLLAANANSYSTDLANGITVLNNLTSWGSSSDSYWNMCDVSEASNITVEGIGVDAGIYQWGFTFSKCNSIEVKNLTFDHYTEDAIGIQGGSNSSLNYGNYWIHNCTFEEGVNRWDVSDDQDKSDGDGSTDFKYAHNLTISYCEYNGTHKTNLIGSNNAALQYNITLHHNYYLNCKARLPLVRQANIHMYNNYYKGTTSTGISARAHAFAFVENCYFDGRNPFMLAYEVKDSVNPIGTTIKAVGNGFSTSTTTLDSSSNGLGIMQNGIFVLTGSGSNKAYSSNTSITRTTAAPSTSVCTPNGSTSYVNFDTNSTLFYYANGKSNVKVMNTAAELPTLIPTKAGAGNFGGTID